MWHSLSGCVRSPHTCTGAGVISAPPPAVGRQIVSSPSWRTERSSGFLYLDFCGLNLRLFPDLEPAWSLCCELKETNSCVWPSLSRIWIQIRARTLLRQRFHHKMLLKLGRGFGWFKHFDFKTKSFQCSWASVSAAQGSNLEASLLSDFWGFLMKRIVVSLLLWLFLFAICLFSCLLILL